MKTENRTNKITKLLKAHLLNSKDRKVVAAGFHKLGHYHAHIPLKEICDILKASGIVLLQEDNTEWCGFLCGEKSRCTISIAYALTAHDVYGIPTYDPIENSLLIMAWEKLSSTRTETVAYLS